MIQSLKKPKTLRITPSRELKVSPVFDTYWKFAGMRQDLFMKKVLNTPDSSAVDPILSVHRFTNTYRAADRVSQYLIRNVIYNGDQSPAEVFFRTLLFKIFNKIETWELLKDKLGTLSWRNFDFEKYARILDRAMIKGQRIYSAAYIMPSPSFGNTKKHRNHLRLIEHMMRDDAPQKISSAKSLKSVFELLKGYKSFGDFLAFQFCIDLNYSDIIDFSEMDFVVAGPGAKDGIKKCFVDAAGLNEADIIRVMTEIADQEFERLGIDFQSLWGRPLQLIDCQNIFCEVDKYSRIAHPEFTGKTGRTRIKQKYTPNSAPLPQWYPAKWELSIPVAISDSNHGARQQASYR